MEHEEFYLFDTLKCFADLRSGYLFTKRVEHDPNGNTAVVQIANVTDGVLNPVGLNRVTLAKAKADVLLRKGDILLNTRSTSNMAMLVDTLEIQTVPVASLVIIRPNTLVLPEFLHWTLNHPYTQNDLKCMQSGERSQSITIKRLSHLSIPCPNKIAQERIVHVATHIAQEDDMWKRTRETRIEKLNHDLMKKAWRY